MGCLKLPYKERSEGLEKSTVFLGEALEKKSALLKNCNNYYPFGLTFNSYERVTAKKNDFLFNGIERETELDLGWDLADYRAYDPAIGRWLQIDPKANSRESPYVGMGNNPLLYSDPLGDTVIYFVDNEGAGGQGHMGMAFQTLEHSYP